MSFKIALINVWWNENSIDQRLFNSTIEQNQYFNTLTSGYYTDLLNFNISNNIETEICYYDKSNRTITELLRCNYAVVDEFNSNNQLIRRRFYFAYPRQDSGKQLIVKLVLDDIQQNYLTIRENSNAFIKKAHLNRWQNFLTPLYFDTGIYSNLYERTEFNFNKRLSKRTKIHFNTFFENLPNIKNFMDNQKGWYYIFLDPNHSFTFKDKNNNTFTAKLPVCHVVDKDTGSTYSTQFPIICLPSEDNIIEFTSSDRTIDVYTIQDFLNDNNDFSYIYSMKFSELSPFSNAIGPNAPANMPCQVLADNMIEFQNCTENTQYISNTYISSIRVYEATQNHNGVICVTSQTNYVLSDEFTPIKKLKYNLSSVLSLRNPDFNPKFCTSDFYEIRLKNMGGGETFTYDFLKLGMEKFKIKHSEILTPDVQRTYDRIYNTSGIYSADCEDNLTGLVYSNDNSIPFANSYISEFLAQNKNFYLQNAINFGTELSKGFINAFSGKTLSGVENVVNMTTGLINLSITEDNMKNSPSSMKNAQGNILFTQAIDNIGLYIEEFEVIPFEKNIADDEMYLKGFNFNKRNLLQNMDSSRVYFNYIEADEIMFDRSVKLSNIEKERLANKLKAIRFWHTDTMELLNENYEVNLT